MIKAQMMIIVFIFALFVNIGTEDLVVRCFSLVAAFSAGMFCHHFIAWHTKILCQKQDNNMTQEEFKKHAWSANTHCTFKGEKRLVVSVNFDQALIGLGNDYDENDIDWVRCEAVELDT